MLNVKYLKADHKNESAFFILKNQLTIFAV